MNNTKEKVVKIRFNDNRDFTEDGIYDFADRIIQNKYDKVEVTVHGIKIVVDKNTTKGDIINQYMNAVNKKRKIEQASLKRGRSKTKLPRKKLGYYEVNPVW